MKPKHTIATTSVLIFVIVLIGFIFYMNITPNKELILDIENPNVTNTTKDTPLPLPNPIIIPQKYPKEKLPYEQTIDDSPLSTYYEPVINMCEGLLLSQTNYRNAVNIVVIGSAFDSYEQFKSMTKTLFFDDTYSFFNIEPMKQRKDSFNVWLHPSNISLFDVYKISKDCPLNYILHLKNYDGYSYALGTLTIVNTGNTDDKSFVSSTLSWTVSHELLHIIGDFDDEYADLTNYGYAAGFHGITCSNNYNCSEFAGVPGVTSTDCFEGCNYYKNSKVPDRVSTYRTSSSSIMRSVYSKLNPLQKFVMNRRIDLQIAYNKDPSKRPLLPSYIRKFGNGICEFNEEVDYVADCPNVVPKPEIVPIPEESPKPIILPVWTDMCINSIYGKDSLLTTKISVGLLHWLGNSGNNYCVFNSISTYPGGCINYIVPPQTSNNCNDLNAALACGKLSPQEYKNRLIANRLDLCMFE